MNQHPNEGDQVIVTIKAKMKYNDHKDETVILEPVIDNEGDWSDDSFTAAGAWGNAIRVCEHIVREGLIESKGN